MTDYDIESQRSSAIKILYAKQSQIYSQGSREVMKTYAMSFNRYCEMIEVAAEAEYARDVFDNDHSLLTKLAFKYLKLKELIKRLEGGADPRVILLEVVSSDD